MVHSYSKWLTWHKCAAKYNYSYNLKLPQNFGPAAARGTEVHATVDKYILGQAPRLHPDIHKTWGAYIEPLMQFECAPEEKWAVDKKWNIVPWDDKKSWARGIFDLRVKSDAHLEIKEWKTGKIYEEHAYQKHLYGTIALILFPTYNSVTVTGVYFDQSKKAQPAPEEYSLSDLPMMKLTWKDRFTRLEKDKDFNPNPTFMCRFCDYSAAKGGPCRF